jgi:hypothetical protein
MGDQVMTGFVKHPVTAIFVLIIALVATIPVSAQGIVVGGGMPGTGTILPGSSTSLAGGLGSSLYSPYSSGYYPPYYPPYYPYPYSPEGDYLRGAADVYRAQGNYLVNYSQSQILMEKARQDVLDTRRKIYDQWLYERNNTPSLQDLRERDQKMDLRRALTDPPLYEITDGRALNTLLKKAISTSTAGSLPNVPLSPEVLKNINVAVDVGLGLGAVKGLRDGAPLDWPAVLQSSDYDADRKDLENVLRDAVDDASRTGTVNINSLQKIQADYANLSKKLDENIFHLTADQYLAGKRYLKQLNNSIQALQKKNVEKYFNRLEKVRSVADLLKEMGGETFAPAGVGDEKAYVALHQALVAYVMQLQPAAPDK